MQDKSKKQPSAFLTMPQVAVKNTFYLLLWFWAQDEILLPLPYESGPGYRSLILLKENKDIVGFASHL